MRCLLSLLTSFVVWLAFVSARSRVPDSKPGVGPGRDSLGISGSTGLSGGRCLKLPLLPGGPVCCGARRGVRRRTGGLGLAGLVGNAPDLGCILPGSGIR